MIEYCSSAHSGLTRQYTESEFWTSWFSPVLIIVRNIDTLVSVGFSRPFHWVRCTRRDSRIILILSSRLQRVLHSILSCRIVLHVRNAEGAV
jgi:hypothetical protein